MKGFTLIELCIVIIISGLLLTGFFELLKQHNANKDINEINKKFELIRLSLNNFKHDDPDVEDDPVRFPCPAPLHLKPGDKGYGVEYCPWRGSVTDDSKIGAGLKSLNFLKSGEEYDGVFVLESLGQRPLEDINGTIITPRDEKRLVLIGALPARTLGLSPRSMVDPYDNLFMYAVTLDLTLHDALLTRPAIHGAIKVVDSFDEDVNNSARFFLYSPGEDRAGAFLINGEKGGTPCRDTIQGDALNCNWQKEGYAVFRENNGFSHGRNNDYYDDFTNFYMFSHKENSGWLQSMGEGGENIIAKNSGALILGNVEAEKQSEENDKYLNKKEREAKEAKEEIEARKKLIVGGDIGTNRIVFAKEPEIEIDESSMTLSKRMELIQKKKKGKDIAAHDLCNENTVGTVRLERQILQFCDGGMWKSMLLGGINCPPEEVLTGIGINGSPLCVPLPK